MKSKALLLCLGITTQIWTMDFKSLDLQHIKDLAVSDKGKVQRLKILFHNELYRQLDFWEYLGKNEYEKAKICLEREEGIYKLIKIDERFSFLNTFIDSIKARAIKVPVLQSKHVLKHEYMRDAISITQIMCYLKTACIFSLQQEPDSELNQSTLKILLESAKASFADKDSSKTS